MSQPANIRAPHSAPVSEAGPSLRPQEITPHPTWLNGGMAVVDAGSRVLEANEALALWLGRNAGELTGLPFAELVGNRNAGWREEVQKLLATAKNFDRIELVARQDEFTERLGVEICRHGDIRFLRLESGVPPARELENLFPENTWSSVAIHDSFQRMLRAEVQLENLIHRWPGIIFSQRPDFSFAFISPRIEELTGITAPDWQRHSKYFWQVIHESDAKPLMTRLREAARSPGDLTGTFRIRHARTGRVSYLWEHRQPVFSSNGLLLGYEGIWLDISRQTIAERRLLNLSWKENLGTLTMGLAHDFCNIMTGIVALSETFESELGANSSLRDGLNMIRTTAIEAGQLSQRIRQLHHGTPGEKNYHDLNEIVTSIAAVLQKVLPRRVRVVTELAGGQIPVYLDEVELRQVLVNLALNAADAMPNGGHLTFRTTAPEQMPVALNFHGNRPAAPLACVSVQDTGTGIPESFVNSIFDPFFTTKPLGKGSGLGLYNARLFVEKHGAGISLETKEKAGTTFHLWFAQANFTEAETAQKAAQLSRHTLLLVGSTEKTLAPIADQLRENGYYIVSAVTEAAALESLHSPNFHFTGLLLICDGGSGERVPLFSRVRAESMPLKTLCLVNCNQDEMDSVFLQKVDAVLPFGTAIPDLLARLKSVLGAPANSHS
ncbi:MAG: ATP-binding protein [Verrucomicrobiota bacterium]